MEVGLEYVGDRESELACTVDVLLDVALRVDHHGAAGGLIAHQIRRMGQALKVELFEDHRVLAFLMYTGYPTGYPTATAGDGTEEPQMKIEQDVLTNLQRRLARIEGQVRAVQTMLAEGRECRDIITQVSAASTALDQVGFRLLSAGLQQCMNDPKQAKRDGFDLEEVEKLFLKLA